MHKINQKGFTLLELLGVIVLLGIIATAIMVLSTRLLGNSKQSLYETQIENIKTAAKNWAVSNHDKLPTNTNDEYKLSLTELSDKGYIDNSLLIDPRNNKEINACIIIKYKETVNQYSYQFQEENC